MRFAAASFLLAIVVDGIRTRSKSRRWDKKISGEDPGQGLYDDEQLARGVPKNPEVKPDDFAKCYLSKSDCNMADMTGPTLVYTDSPNSKCWNGDPWAFHVRPGKRNKLVMNFPGGGACWEMPFFIPGAISLCYESMMEGVNALGWGVGIFADRPDNAFNDYTVVSPTYCGGGAHVANTTVRDFFKTYYQYDYNNNEFARQWAMKNVDSGNLESFVIQGSSAGSLGTAVWTDMLLSTLKYKKAAVLLDSYMGVFPDGFTNVQAEVLQGFEACNLPPSKHFQKECLDGSVKMEDILDKTIAKFPNVAFAHLQAKTDTIQMLFYTAVAWSFLDIPSLIITNQEFYKKSNAIMQKLNKHPNYVTYLVVGDWHTFFPGDVWYTASIAGENSPAPSGTPGMAEWATKLIAHEAVSSQCFGERKANGARGSGYCDEKLFPKTLRL